MSERCADCVCLTCARLYTLCNQDCAPQGCDDGPAHRCDEYDPKPASHADDLRRAFRCAKMCNEAAAVSCSVEALRSAIGLTRAAQRRNNTGAWDEPEQTLLAALARKEGKAGEQG